MPFQKGRQKTGGREKGTGNKLSTTFRKALDTSGFSIPNEAIALYKTAAERNEFHLQLAILKFLTGYSHPKLRELEIQETSETNDLLVPEENEDKRKKILEIMTALNANGFPQL